jgi:hypothetical protein
VNALLTAAVVPLEAATYLAATFKILASGNPEFNYAFDAVNSCAKPAHARLWFARSDDTGGEFYR